jgi:hypothetical protein
MKPGVGPRIYKSRLEALPDEHQGGLIFYELGRSDVLWCSCYGFGGGVFVTLVVGLTVGVLVGLAGGVLVTLVVGLSVGVSLSICAASAFINEPIPSKKSSVMGSMTANR